MFDSGKTQSANVLSWKEVILECQKPSTGRAVWQLVNTLGPYVLVWAVIYWSLQISYWLTIPLVLLAGAFMVRIFLIFHDCRHGSFFKSRRANDILGFLTGILTFTPYYH